MRTKVTPVIVGNRHPKGFLEHEYTDRLWDEESQRYRYGVTFSDQSGELWRAYEFDGSWWVVDYATMGAVQYRPPTRALAVRTATQMWGPHSHWFMPECSGDAVRAARYALAHHKW